jgi:hypothetical protein
MRLEVVRGKVLDLDNKETTEALWDGEGLEINPVGFSSHFAET